MGKGFGVDGMMDLLGIAKTGRQGPGSRGLSNDHPNLPLLLSSCLGKPSGCLQRFPTLSCVFSLCMLISSPLVIHLVPVRKATLKNLDQLREDGAI